MSEAAGNTSAEIEHRRGPDRRSTAGNRRTGQRLRMREFVAVALSSGLRSRRAQTSPPVPGCWWVHGASSRLGGTGAPRARRPVGSTAATNARGRNRRASPPWAAIARSPTVPPSILGTTASESPSASICVICGQFARASGSPSCLRAFVFAMSSVFLSVSL